VTVRVRELSPIAQASLQWIIASAVPKGNRADWMVEKLSELGTGSFIPLVTARSIVVPEGKNKVKRWQRLAEEAAKQSRRRGIMQIGAVAELAPVLKHLQSPQTSKAWYFSTAPGAMPVGQAIDALKQTQPAPSSLLLFIGPEGGWTDEEIRLFTDAGLTGVGMGGTILRIETAAVAAAAIVAAMVAPHFLNDHSESA
jgi:16S rRNA (uracil1498-N3)-methyltransferase